MSLHDVMQACSTGTGSHDLENSIYEKGALIANVYLSIVSSYLNDVHQNYLYIICATLTSHSKKAFLYR